ncbi:MAG: hypothetical protein V4657_03910, partial [Pseudomonadota bacterium]
MNIGAPSRADRATGALETLPVAHNLRKGVGAIAGSLGNDGSHNFRDNLADRSRLVFIDVNRSGFARLFKYIPFHGGQYGDKSAQCIERKS